MRPFESAKLIFGLLAVAAALLLASPGVRVAPALADELVRQGLVQPVSDWTESRDRRFREHHASLDDFYFAKGLERLERLRCWTQGKADGVRGASGTREPPRGQAPDDAPRPEDEHHANGST